MASDDGDEPVGCPVYVPVYVSGAGWGRLRCCLVLPIPLRGRSGHLPVLLVRGRGAELHLPHHQPLRGADQHHHHHNPEVREHSRVVAMERQRAVCTTMDWRGHGVLRTLVPDLVQAPEEHGQAHAGH